VVVMGLLRVVVVVVVVVVGPRLMTVMVAALGTWRRLVACPLFHPSCQHRRWVRLWWHPAAPHRLKLRLSLTLLHHPLL
jgi:hypothetical protein